MTRIQVTIILCCVLSHTGFAEEGVGKMPPSSKTTPADEFYADKTAGTWLPLAGSESSNNEQVDEFLEELNGRMRLLACWYEGPHLIATRSFRQGELKTNATRWSCDIDTAQVNGHQDALDLDVAFELTEGLADQAGVAVAFDFSDWCTANYVMIPASVYSANRCKIVNRGYAKGLDRKYLYKKNLPLMSNPIPQLSPDMGTPSKLEVNSSNTATPAMCFYNPQSKRAFIVLTEQGIPCEDQVIDHGFMIEESLDRKKSTFVISAPGVRERKPLFIGFANSPDRGIPFKTGDRVTIRMRIYSFETENIPGLLEKFMSVRKDVTGPNSPRELIPFSQVTKWMTHRIDSRWHEGEVHKFYCPENAPWISFGWVGGLINTFPMLVLGDTMHRNRVVQTFDFAIPRAQGDAGYFYGAINHDGKPFGRETYDEFPEIALTRKNGDVLFWMIKQFMLLKAQGRVDMIKPAWEKNIQRLADAFVKTWKTNGQWGRMVNNKTGQVAEYNTSGGVMAIGGLALAADYYRKTDYLEIAQEAATFYYQRDFVKTGQTTGGCADILQNADSETAAGLMTALMALYETTRDRTWLEKSRNLANLCATWTTSYDYQLPNNTELGRLGAKLAGVYWASTQNKHGAPGICTSSGDPLFKIYRATGDRRYAELMRDIVRCHAESIRPGGYTNERLTYCDADSRGNRGDHVTGWNETNGILMAMELPGIYVRTDKNEMIVFDHVKADVLARDKNGVTLKIRNSTKFAAEVSILAESAKEAEKMLGYTAFLKWPKVEVPSGKSVHVRILEDFQVEVIKSLDGQ